MTKATSLSIQSLEKQVLVLEEKIIKAKNKKISQIEKSIVNNQQALKKLKAKGLAGKKFTKRKAYEKKQHALKAGIANKSAEIKALKTALVQAKAEYQYVRHLQKVKSAAAKMAAKPKRKKRVQGPKIKAKIVHSNTKIPVNFLNIDITKPVRPIV